MKEEIKILIVDDIGMNVEMIKNIIEDRGYIALCALSVREAVNILKKELPSLILSDISMPEIDGLSFCRMVKSNPKAKDIPVIFISILDTVEEKERAFDAGAADFISKPFNAEEVIMRVDNHLNFSRMKREMADYNHMMHRLVEKQQKQIEEEQTRILSIVIRMLERLDGSMGRRLKNVGESCRILSQSLQLLPKYENVITDRFTEIIGSAAELCSIESFLQDFVRNAGAQGMESTGQALRRGGFLEEIAEDGKKSKLLEMASNIEKYRSAHWDGTGSPELKGEDIPLEARIMALAEDFSIQIGKMAEEENPAKEVQRINEQSGRLYDPDIVRVFNKVWQRMVAF